MAIGPVKPWSYKSTRLLMGGYGLHPLKCQNELFSEEGCMSQ